MNHLNATEASNINTPGVLDTATETSIGFAVGGISGTVISIISATALPAVPIVPILAPITLSIIGAVKAIEMGQDELSNLRHHLLNLQRSYCLNFQKIIAKGNNAYKGIVS